MRIDAHQHFWRLGDRRGAWPPPALAAIHRDFMPTDLAPTLAAEGIDGTILVQSLPSRDDTDFMLDLSAQHEFVRGVVGWIDLKAADAPSVIEAMAAAPKLVGVRPMLQDLADDDWIADPLLDPAISSLIRAGLAVDALVLPRHLPFLETFARRHPDLRIVIDHGAKPPIARGGLDEWRRAMARLAALDHVHCKLSGLLTEADEQSGDTVTACAETVLALFGANRVIWGSDWPVVTLAGTYAGWLAQCRAIVPAADHAAVFGDNARRFYRLPEVA